MTTVAANRVNRPRVLVSPRWRPTKAISAWPGSIDQVPSAGRSTPSIVWVALMAASDLGVDGHGAVTQTTIDGGRHRQLGAISGEAWADPRVATFGPMIVVVAALKGGVGKTTTAVYLA